MITNTFIISRREHRLGIELAAALREARQLGWHIWKGERQYYEGCSCRECQEHFGKLRTQQKGVRK